MLPLKSKVSHSASGCRVILIAEWSKCAYSRFQRIISGWVFMSPMRVCFFMSSDERRFAEMNHLLTVYIGSEDENIRIGRGMHRLSINNRRGKRRV